MNYIKKNLLFALCAASALSGCATKGAKEIFAFPKLSETITSPTQSFLSPERTKPGQIMDPNSLTFAQVPTRILYIPSEGGLFSRKSSSQHVAYELIPVDFNNTAHLNPTLASSNNLNPSAKPELKEFFRTTFLGKDGQERTGTARRLGLLGKSTVEKERATLLLKGKESLEWSPEAGWIGFLAEKKTKQAVAKSDPTVIEPSAPKPDIETPIINQPATIPTPVPTPVPNSDQNLNPPARTPTFGTGLDIEF